MDDSRQHFHFTLAGLQAGVLGTLAMVGWLILCSVAVGRSPWLPINLFAILFHGPNAYRDYYHPDSWSGMAFLIFTYGLAGAAWGQLVGFSGKTEGYRVLALCGVLTGLILHTVEFGMLVKSLAPIIGSYAPDMQMRVGHVLWGLALANTPVYARRIAFQNSVR